MHMFSGILSLWDKGFFDMFRARESGLYICALRSIFPCVDTRIYFEEVKCRKREISMVHIFAKRNLNYVIH